MKPQQKDGPLFRPAARRDDNKNQSSYIRVFALCQKNLRSKYAPVNGALLRGRAAS